MCVCVCVCVYVCLCFCICLCVYMYACVCVCVCVVLLRNKRGWLLNVCASFIGSGGILSICTYTIDVPFNIRTCVCVCVCVCACVPESPLTQNLDTHAQSRSNKLWVISYECGIVLWVISKEPYIVLKRAPHQCGTPTRMNAG